MAGIPAALWSSAQRALAAQPSTVALRRALYLRDKRHHLGAKALQRAVGLGWIEAGKLGYHDQLGELVLLKEGPQALAHLGWRSDYAYAPQALRIGPDKRLRRIDALRPRDPSRVQFRLIHQGPFDIGPRILGRVGHVNRLIADEAELRGVLAAFFQRVLIKRDAAAVAGGGKRHSQLGAADDHLLRACAPQQFGMGLADRPRQDPHAGKVVILALIAEALPG